MPKFETVHRVQHECDVMYDIVADVEKYPEFLELCEDLKILSKSDRSEEGQQLLEADMTVGFKAIREVFRSKVTLDKTNNIITSENINGPFKYMKNKWRFVPVNETSTDIHFSIDYEFKNWMMEKLLGGMFDKAFRTYAKSFENRADTLKKTSKIL
ncbi:type II toxin-antitoxin system RatA family toxin [Hyphomicrobiales bacterium 4NK60-0047b]